MKNKYSILLIFLCFIFTYIYILDANYKNINPNFYIEVSKPYSNIEPIEEGYLEEKNKKDLININSANKDTLKSLPYIGESLAENIIYYRENVSFFNEISDIKKVERIGDKIYEKIKDLITVN